MKNASAAAIAILSGGSYLRADLWQLTLVTGQSYYFTSFDVPLTAQVQGAVSPQTWLTGMTIMRGSMTQKTGLDTQELDVKFAPQWDSPGGPPLIAGYNIMQAARLGILDNAQVSYSKLFMNYPLAGAYLDVSPNAVPWFSGVAASMDIGRFELDMKVSSNLITLNQVQMPKNLYQGGCSHTLYDAGCTLLKAAFTSTGHVTAVTDGAHFTTSLTTQATGYFALGVLTFTSGANNGFSTTVNSFTTTTGAMAMAIPFPAAIAVNDTFTVYPGCDHLQATCTTKFNNLTHFKGMPYIPVPETLYDGGTSQGNDTGVINNTPATSGVSGRIGK